MLVRPVSAVDAIYRSVRAICGPARSAETGTHTGLKPMRGRYWPGWPKIEMRPLLICGKLLA